MNRTIGYCRVSTEEQSNGISLELQQERITAYCMINDLPSPDFVIDAGKTGKNLKREGIKELMEHLGSGVVGNIVVYKMDRLSRRVIDLLGLIEEIERAGIKFHSVQEKIDTSTASGRFFVNVTAAFAQMERDLISERTRSALRFKTANGQRAGNIPYGWRIEAGSDELLPDPGEIEILNMCDHLRSQGFSYQKIADKLNELGYYTRSGGSWKKQYVHSLLN